MGRLIDIDVLFDYFGNDAIDETTRSNIEYFVSEKGTVEAIPKADYENRLKADMVAMLTDMLIDVEEIASREQWCDYANDNCISRYDVEDLFQQKINSLKEAKDGENNY